ncbi:MAG TPA: hypothetical protein PKK15_07780 [Kouleothrix sp.]|uniref:hypothetical protein n=1 Tax=Kouleothrix sp. TaxID=2779161 RepID=UPI002C9AEFB1|nr:hypothetical protein [Kouleothrix sp.]
MSDQQQAGERQASAAPEIKRPIDLAALTAAVERLLRRDLRLARERAGGKR